MVPLITKRIHRTQRIRNNNLMRLRSTHILPILLFFLLLSCGKTPNGVMSQNEMADLIVDLQLAEAYIDSHSADFPNDSSKLVVKQSIFKKHGITPQDYDSSLVWYTHNMEDYVKAYDKAVGKLKNRYDKLDNRKLSKDDMDDNAPGMPSRDATPRSHTPKGLRNLGRQGGDATGDTTDLWQGTRRYMLAQGSKQGFITFNLPNEPQYQPGDRYQLAYKLYQGGNKFKVCLNVDYTNGSTAQITRATGIEGWVTVDLQSDSTLKVRRVYGYISYDISPGRIAYIDSLTLMRTRLNPGNYGSIHAQRLLERNK